MGVSVLGPVEVDGGSALEPRDRAVLAVLTIRRGQIVSPAEIADALWHESPPGSWPKQVQICIGRIRRVLGSTTIETTEGGYRLTLADDDIDARRFELLVQRGRALTVSGEPDRAAATLGRALALWRGPPLENLDGWLPARGEAARLEELRRTAQEDWLDARLAAGDHREVAAEAEALVHAEPLRERRWMSLALAQYRCARQGDALRSLARARRVLVEQLGVSPGPQLTELESAILRQDPALGTVAEPAAVSADCPYRGLAPFDEEDADSFFGRDAETAACLERLRCHPCLVVAGPSGCGKSSLVRAGVAPGLRGRGHDVVVLVPGNDPRGTAAEIRTTVDGTVVVVDQFEELFALGHPAEAVRDLCQVLVTHAGCGGLVVLAIRSDRLGALSADPELSRLVERGLHLLTPLAGDPLRRAIEEPARLAGLRLEHGLVELLVRDCDGEPGGLPMLSHALVETWRRRDGATLTVEGYRASGGIRGAVARSADRLYDSLPAEERATLRGVLLRLVTPSLDGDPVRCRVPSRSLLGDPQRERVVGLLVRARLVTSEVESFEVAHEALARAWPRLRSWLDEDVAGQRILRHLGAAADGWDTLGRPDTELYRGGRLETVLEWRDHTNPQLTELEQTFVDASDEHARSERRALEARAVRDAATNRRLRRLLLLSALLVIAALVAGVVAVRQADRADTASALSGVRELAATAIADVDVDPERSVLLALAALDRVGPDGGRARGAIEQALHVAINATRVERRLADADRSIGWSFDGQRIFTIGRARGDVEIRDAATGETLRSFAAHDGGATGVDDSADGALLATTGRDGALRIWDAATGGQRFAIRGEGRTERPSFTADRAIVAAAWPEDHGGVVRIVDATTASVIREIAWPDATGLSLSPDGTDVALMSLSSGAVFDIASGRQVASLDVNLGGLTDLAWSPDGRSIAIGHEAGGAEVHDATTGQQSIVIPGHGAQVQAVAWSPDSTLLATASADGTTKVWSMLEGGDRLMMTLTADDTRSGFRDVAFSPDGTRIVTSTFAGTVHIWRAGLDAGAEVAILPGAAFLQGGAKFTPDGRLLLASSASGLTVWDTRTWEAVREIGTGSAPSTPTWYGIPLASTTSRVPKVLVPNPHGSLIAALSDDNYFGVDGTLHVYDVDGGRRGFDVEIGRWVSWANWTRDGALLAVAGGDDDGVAVVRIFDRSGNVVSTLPFPDRFVDTAQFMDGDQRLVIVHRQLGERYVPGTGRVEVWDWRGRDVLNAIDVDGYEAVPSPTGHLVAIGPHEVAADQVVTIWDADSGERRATLAGHTGLINDVVFSPDGTRVATGSHDGSIRLWDPLTGQQLLELNGHGGLVSDVGFSPDGRRLAAYGAEGMIRVWTLDLDELADIARHRVTRALTAAECDRYVRDRECDQTAAQ